MVSTLWQLIARYAWVGTLGLLILWGLLGFGQSRELLFGIGELLWMAGNGLLAPGLQSFGWTAYIAFWLAALMLAAVFGIVVRVTGFRASQQGPAPDTWAKFDPRPIYPRLVAIAALVIVHNAFVREQPLANGWLASVFMLLALAPTILFAAASGNRRQLIRFAAPIAILAMATIWVFSNGLGRDSSAAILLSIATPAAAGLLPWPRCSDRTWHAILLGIGLLLLILLFGPWPSTLPLTVGSVAVAFTALSFVIAVVAIMVVGRDRLRIDALFGIVLLGVCLWLVPERFGNEHLEDIAVPPACAAGTSCLQAGAGMASPDHRLPVGFALHADGGGIRAALYTAQVLALADDITCGEFGRYVFAASGVSGGALGIATWAALRQDYIRNTANGAWAECSSARDRSRAAGGANVDLASYPLFDQVSYTLAQDHLSPSLASMVAWDLLPWGWASRGQALMQSWQETATLAAGETTSPPMAFARPLKDANAGVQPAPRLYFTSTDADSGKRVVFSNASPQQDAYHQRLQLGVAALNSARFPIISPAGLAYDAGRDRWIRVVDGGYFDNSGAATLLDALRRIPGSALPKTLSIARIDGNAADDGGQCQTILAGQENGPVKPAATGMQDRLDEARDRLEKRGWSGTSAFVSARGARADQAVNDLKEATFAGVTVQHLPDIQLDYESFLVLGCKDRDAATCRTWMMAACPVLARQRHAPLGWYLSQAAIRPMGRSAFTGLVSLLSPLGPYLGAQASFNMRHPTLGSGL